jgi:acyl carrier protein
MNSNPSVTGTTHQLTETERRIAALWKDVLDIPELPDAGENFFALGGDSTAMVMVELQIKDEFSVDLPAGAMLSAQSLRELSAMVDKHVRPDLPREM